jgi:hypothetical protein
LEILRKVRRTFVNVKISQRISSSVNQTQSANAICPRLPRFDRNSFLKTVLNLEKKNVVSPLVINVHNAGGESTLETQEKNDEILACGIRK